MNKKMLVESDPHQVRIAVLEADRLTEVFVERHGHRGVVGNVYKGRVTRVLPGMQAAFVDIGLQRDAFLYVSDVVSIDSDFESEDSPLDGGKEPLGRELSTAELPNGELPNGESKGEPTSKGQAADGERGGSGVDDSGACDPADGESEVAEAATRNQPSRSIEELLRDGQEVIVQVTKDALPNKGARVSTHVTLPSRNLVLLPTVGHLGISRRIEDEAERDRLRAILGEMTDSAGGLIVRTAGEGSSREELEPEKLYLDELWRRIQSGAERLSPPALIHRDQDLALRVVRDLFNEEFSVLWVDDEDSYQRIVEFLDQVQPGLASRVKMDQREAALFERFQIEQEIEAALAPKVWLKSGGYLIINQTEALVAIDVNTGRFVGRHSLEETVLATNLEAVTEAVRQIRLRDLSGIVIIDLIDMAEAEHRDQVFSALETELEKDRARSKVLNISEFGLVELTRKRSHANLERLLTRSCPYCQGAGRIKTLATICLNIRRAALQHLRAAPVGGELLIRVHPEVAEVLQTGERAILEELEGEAGERILIQSDAELHHERFDLTEV